MVSEITKGVKITVRTTYQGSFYKQRQLCYAFSYDISIENGSSIPIKIDSRFWKIQDSLAQTKFIQGEGIVGERPVLYPNQTHQYASGCLLNSSTGAMQGHYEVINVDTGKIFKVNIPAFKLTAPFTLN